MVNRRTAWILGSVALMSAATLGAVACSSSSTTALPGGGDDASTPDSSAGGDSGGTTMDMDGGTTTDQDGGSDGGSTCTPPALHVPKDAGDTYCPFSFNDATDSGTQYCNSPTQMCCVSPASASGPSDCETKATTCATAGFKVWQCASPVDCGGGSTPVCCLIGGPLKADCGGFQKTNGFDSTTCVANVAACPASIVVDAGGGKAYTDTGFIACEQDSDCAAVTGKTHCLAIKTTGTSIGVCQP